MSCYPQFLFSHFYCRTLQSLCFKIHVPLFLPAQENEFFPCGFMTSNFLWCHKKLDSEKTWELIKICVQDFIGLGPLRELQSCWGIVFLQKPLSFKCEVVQEYMKHKDEYFKIIYFPTFSLKSQLYNSKKKKKILVLKSKNRRI